MDVARRSIWDRKVDILYLIFFVIHIPIMLRMCFDHPNAEAASVHVHDRP